ncbi:MAG: TonB-dependent receptor, partial [Bacteroidota bacterium]
MKQILFFFLFFGTLLASAQNKYTINGTLTETDTGETLIGVNVIVPELQTGALTNEYGFYSLTLPEGEYEVVFSGLGFATKRITLLLDRDITQNVSLAYDAEELEEVVISADVERASIRAPQMSVNTLSTNTIKSIPVLLGEADVVKSLLLLPGVSNAGEGASGFNVRGGAVDQNLILLDEATIFNSSHLFGFFSVFNPDAIKDVKLFKGG